MGTKRYFGVHTHKIQVRTVIFTGTGAIIDSVIGFYQIITPCLIRKKPLLEFLHDKFLFGSGLCRFGRFYNIPFLAVHLNLDFYCCRFEVECIFYQLISCFVGGSVSGGSLHIPLVCPFVGDKPCTVYRRILHINELCRRRIVSMPLWGVYKLIHKIPDILRFYPS